MNKNYCDFPQFEILNRIEYSDSENTWRYLKTKSVKNSIKKHSVGSYHIIVLHFESGTPTAIKKNKTRIHISLLLSYCFKGSDGFDIPGPAGVHILHLNEHREQ